MSLSEQEITAIKETYTQMIQCILVSDWEGYAATYTDDAVFLPPEGEMFQAQGQQSLIDWTVGFVDEVENLEISDGIEVIGGGGDCAYLYAPATEERVKVSGTDKPLEFRGKSVSIFEKNSDGVWKIKLQIWNKYQVE